MLVAPTLAVCFHFCPFVDNLFGGPKATGDPCCMMSVEHVTDGWRDVVVDVLFSCSTVQNLDHLWCAGLFDKMQLWNSFAGAVLTWAHVSWSCVNTGSRVIGADPSDRVPQEVTTDLELTLDAYRPDAIVYCLLNERDNDKKGLVELRFYPFQIIFGPVCMMRVWSLMPMY